MSSREIRNQIIRTNLKPIKKPIEVVNNKIVQLENDIKELKKINNEINEKIEKFLINIEYIEVKKEK